MVGELHTMNILYISQGNIPSKWAHTFQAMKMADALAGEVDALTLVTSGGLLSGTGESPDCADWYGTRNHFTMVRLPVFWRLEAACFTWWKSPRFDRAAALYARVTSPDFVYTRSAYAGRLCVTLGLKTVIELHMGGGEHSELHHLTAVAGRPKLIGVVTISPALERLYVQSGIPPGKILVWPDAVDVNAFDLLPDKMILRNRLNLPEEMPIATYCGHLYRNRGMEEILQCARELPSVYFLIIGGWDEDIARLRAEAGELSNVCFTGFLPNRQVPAYLKASDILLMPYPATCETAEWMSPMKLFEYMASGLAIVATDLPAIRMHLEHGRNAHLVSPGDAAGMAEAIRCIIHEGDYAHRLGQAARSDVAPYTWHNRARAVMARFCGAAAEGERAFA
jgi:glycosyltransferase involved in cell wall biosynthesis